MHDTQALRVGHALRGRRWVAAALLALTWAPLACSPGGSSARQASSSATITTSPITPSSSTPSTVAAPSRLDIVATDYEWSGLPDRLPAGTYPLTLRNDGPDVHEIQVFRNTDDLSLPDLFALGPVEMKARVELAGGDQPPAHRQHAQGLGGAGELTVGGEDGADLAAKAGGVDVAEGEEEALAVFGVAPLVELDVLPRETLGRDLRAGVLAEVEQARADLDRHGPATLPLEPIDRWQGIRRGLVWSALAIAATVVVAMFQPVEVNQGDRKLARAEKRDAEVEKLGRTERRLRVSDARVVHRAAAVALRPELRPERVHRPAGRAARQLLAA